MHMVREEALKKGSKENHAGLFVLYWEVFYSNEVFKGGFTVDHGDIRWRFDTLAEADAKLEKLKIEHAVTIARRAFGL
jgi:hypothetical protein